jgi:hypothetical protein
MFMKNIVKISLLSIIMLSAMIMNAQEESQNASSSEYGRKHIEDFYERLKDHVALSEAQRIPWSLCHEDLYIHHASKLYNLSGEDRKQLVPYHNEVARQAFDEAVARGTSNNGLSNLGYEIDCLSCHLTPRPDCLLLLENIVRECGKEDIANALPSLSTDKQNSK